MAFFVLSAWPSEPEHRREVHENTVVFFPVAGARSKPAAVICQPFNNPPEFSRLLALELVRDGFVVLTFRWRGEDMTVEAGTARAEEAISWLRDHPEVDADRIVIAGHSVGATLANEAAMADPRIAAVAAVGMETDVSVIGDKPRNLLWAIGLYDQIWRAPQMRQAFEAATRSGARDNETIGSFERGTARRLAVSATADHLTELQDRGIQREIRLWFGQAVGVGTPHTLSPLEGARVFFMLGWLLGLAAVLGTFHALAERASWAVRVPPVVGLMAVVASLFVGMPDAAMLLVWSGLSAAIVRHSGHTLLRIAGVLWASIVLTLLLNTLSSYATDAHYLMRIPEFILRFTLDGLYAYVLLYTRRIMTWLMIPLAVEALVPGWILRVKTLLPERGTATSGKSWTRYAALGALVIAFGVVAFIRMQQGFLTADSAKVAAAFIGRYAALPFLIFFLLWRATRGFARSE